jgi:competence ComEA-like helix-hairpin-helix protein
VISDDLLMEIADDVTTLSGTEQPGAININTASVDVLSCLPGITPELAQAIVSYRRSAGYFPNVAHLLKVDGINRDIFRQVSPKVCARSETFRILSEGKINSTGTRKRIQAIVRLSSDNIETISWREDL